MITVGAAAKVIIFLKQCSQDCLYDEQIIFFTKCFCINAN